MERLDDAKDQFKHPRELARRNALYSRTKHPQKWDRFARLQERKFASSVIENKRIFDCLGMVAFSATIFGFAIAGQLSQPMDGMCEQPISVASVLLGLLAFVTAVLAFQPIQHWASMSWALSEKEHLKPFPFRLAGRRFSQSIFHLGTLIAFAAITALAYSVAYQIVARVPGQACVVPQL